MGRRSSFRSLDTGDENTRPSSEKTDEERRLISEALRGNPNLHQQGPLSDEHIEELVGMALKRTVKARKAIMHQGDLDTDVFYIISSGCFEVSSSSVFNIKVEEKGVAHLSRAPSSPEAAVGLTEGKMGPRGCLGELSMLYQSPRFSTGIALEDSEVWVIGQAAFKDVQQRARSESLDRKVSRQHTFSDLEALTTEKTTKDEELLSHCMTWNKNLQRITPLTQGHIRRLVQIAWKQVVQGGEILMKEGDLNAEAFYVVASGKLEVSGWEPFEVNEQNGVSFLSRAAHTGAAAPKNISSKTVRVVERGCCFGEISMLYCAARFATIKALEQSELWVVDRASFQMTQMEAAHDHVQSRAKYLEGLEVMQSFPHSGKNALSGVLETLRFTEGEVMIRKGDPSTCLYILVDGKVTVTGEGAPKELEAHHTQRQTVLQRHHHGEEASRPGRQTSVVSTQTNAQGEISAQFFCEGALLKDDYVSPTTVQVTSDIATALVLERHDLMTMWDGLIEAAPSPMFERLRTQKGKSPMALAKLETVGLIGVCALGSVELCRHKTTGDTYALKRSSKGLAAQRGLRRALMREKSVWQGLASPFIVKLVSVIDEPQSFYFLSEAALGGDLAHIYENYGFYRSASHTKYYVAGVVYALEHLHTLRVVYRNVKPQNILVTCKGHPKLVDFSLAKFVVGQTYTTCGTPNYIAPEVLAGSAGHTRAVDWWSLGVLLFELMSGAPPFESSHPMEVYSAIMFGINRIDFPKHLEGAVGDLIKGLLKQQAVERLPMRQGGIRNIKDHEWFAGFNWADMLALTLAPPWVPNLKSDTDLSNFDVRREDLPEPLEYDDEEFDWLEDIDC